MWGDLAASPIPALSASPQIGERREAEDQFGAQAQPV